MATVAARIAQERRTLGAMIEKRVLLAEASATLGYTGESPEGIRNDSTAGKALLGIIHSLQGIAPTASADIAAVAKSAEIPTAIPWWKIAQAAQSANGDSGVLAGNLLRLFDDAGFRHLQEPATATAPQFLSTYNHKSEYRGEDMLVRFDLATAGKEIDHVFVYLEGHEGQIGDALPVTVNGLSVKIPAAVISERIGTQESAHLQVKLVAWFKGEGDATRIFTKSEGVMWSKGEIVNNENLSTAEVGSQQWHIENAILQRLHLPVSQEAGEWTNNLGSTYHNNTEYFAVDLNIPGSSDLGAEVTAAAGGKIVDWDITTGFIKIEHRNDITINGQLQTMVWYTEYRHMNNILIPSNESEALITSGTLIGNVGKEGKASGAHLHFVVRSNGVAVDISKLLQLHGIKDANERATGTSPYKS